MKNINIRAVIQATLIVLMMDMAIGIVLLLVGSSGSFHADMTDQEINDVIMALSHSQTFLAWSLCLGTLTTAVGGYLAVSMGARSLISPFGAATDAASRHHYWNATGVGLLAIVLGMLFSHDAPEWFRFYGLLLSLPAAILGGYVAIALLAVQSPSDTGTGQVKHTTEDQNSSPDADPPSD